MQRAGLLALLCVTFLTACGDGDERADAPAAATPIPTATAPAPAPTAAESATPTPTPAATPAPAATATPEAGDEEGIHLPLELTVSADRIIADPDTVTAFLPLRVKVTNTLDRAITVVLMQAGDGDVVARVDVRPGASTTVDAEPLQPGTAEAISPDLDPDATAIVMVARATP